MFTGSGTTGAIHKLIHALQLTGTVVGKSVSIMIKFIYISLQEGTPLWRKQIIINNAHKTTQEKFGKNRIVPDICKEFTTKRIGLYNEVRHMYERWYESNGCGISTIKCLCAKFRTTCSKNLHDGSLKLFLSPKNGEKSLLLRALCRLRRSRGAPTKAGSITQSQSMT